MNKALVALVVFVVAAVGAGWWFFAYGGTTSPPLTNEQQKIINTKDERLSLGSSEAPVKIIEYVDVLCPYCAKINQPGEAIPRVIEDYVDTGLAHYEVRLVALASPDSGRAGEGAYCAAEQSRFWQFIDKAYSDTWQQYYSQDKDVSDVDIFEESAINNFAQSVPDLDFTDWRYCMQDNNYAAVMEGNSRDMIELEAHGTPSMVVDGKSYVGTPPYSAFRAVIDASLNEKKAQAEADSDGS